MSLEYQWPSSSGLEREARRLHETPGARTQDDFALGVALHRFPQAFAFTSFALAAALVFPRAFFGGLSHPAGVAAGLAVGALALVIGALPSPLFERVERRHGRGVRMTAARVLLGGATAAIAFLPEGARFGAALLAGCAVLQGVALGGLSLSGDARRLGVPALARPRTWLAADDLIGAGFAALIFGGLWLALSRADLAQWGWRYPFVIMIACNISALYADLRLLGTPNRRPDGHPALTLVASDGVRLDPPGQVRGERPGL